ncbi:uncharacterized protein PG986_003773 [Apiospora aurea]|uniref:Transmembrane protein n=1 Tax=Apiospora aurea TaxID=335848 RepID=A0ABR1QSL9_9PEZI
MLDSYETLLQEVFSPDDNKDLTTAFQAGSETPPPTSSGCSPTEASPEPDSRLLKASSGGSIVLQDDSKASPPASGDCPPTSSKVYPDDLFTDIDDSLAAALRTASDTVPPTSAANSPTGPGLESSGDPAVARQAAASETPLSASSGASPTDPVGDTDTEPAAVLQADSKTPLLRPLSEGGSPTVSETETTDILSKAERFVEPHLRKFLARLESGDAAVQYLLIFCAAGFLILGILLVDVLLVRKGVLGSSMGEEVLASTTGASVASTRASVTSTRASSVTSTGESVASVTVKALESWFQARVVSPYSEVREFVRMDPATKSQQGDDGPEATAGWAPNSTAMEWETSFGGYLVTQLSKMARMSN